jgi:dUTP pyrophosphatase
MSSNDVEEKRIKDSYTKFINKMNMTASGTKLTNTESYPTTSIQLEDNNNNGFSSYYLVIQKMNSDAILPTKGSLLSAGYDLYAYENHTIPPWGKCIVGTRIKISMPVGCYGRIASRSGLSARCDLEVGAGVIDRDYDGEIKIILRNFSNIPYTVKKKDRIAQLILENCLSLTIHESLSKELKQERTNNLKVSESIPISSIFRGSDGFGSTGK